MDSNQIDVVENGAIVKVFLLEAALPSDAGDDILNAAGGFWESYALTHAALGFLVEESHSKHVLEYHATDYVGAFLPDVPPLPPTPAPSTPGPTVAPTPAQTPPSSSSPSETPAPTPSPTVGGGGNGTAPSMPPTPAPASEATFAPTSSSENATENGDGGYDDPEEDNSRRLGGGGGGGGGARDVGGRWRADERAFLGSGNGNGTTEVAWNNKAGVVVSSYFDETTWVTANYVGKITGLLYNDITGWANVYLEEHPAYQPLSACAGSNDRGGNDDFASKGSADSYDFVWAAFERLASNGVIFDQQVVLPPKRTVMCIFPEGGVDATELVAAAGNEEVEEYYRSTGDCVRALATAAAAGNSTNRGPACSSTSSGGGSSDGWAGEGGVSVLLGLGSCLEGQKNAYLFHNATSYLRLPLPTGSNDTVAAAKGGSTVRIMRYAPDMPPRPPSPPGGSDRAYIVYIAVALAAVGLAAAGLRALYRRKRESVAYGRGSGGGGGHGGLFSSSTGGGWRSGGGAGSDFGDFDTVGGGYEGALFPADDYSSGSLSGFRSQGGGRMGSRRGGRNQAPEAAARLEAETVELKRPLLNQSESPTAAAPHGRQAAASSSRRTGGRGGAGAGLDHRSTSGGGGGGFDGSAGRGYGGGDGGDTRRQQRPGRTPTPGGRPVENDDVGGVGEGKGSSSRGSLSPPPFSRILGTMGGGPAAGSTRRKKTRRPGGGGGDDGDDEALDKGPFGDGDGDGGPFAEGGAAAAAGKAAGSLQRNDEPEGDEVFC